MIKKVFVGVLLAGIFGLLVFGAVNRTLAKTEDREPLSLNKNLSEDIRRNEGDNGKNQDPILKRDSDDCDPDGSLYKRGEGFGERTNDCDIEPPVDGSGFQRGGNQQGDGNGQTLGGQPQDMPVEGLGVGQANVEEWLINEGTVISVAPDLWVIELSDGTVLELEGRVLGFLTDQGFSVSESNELTLTGFYHEDSFEIGQIENKSTGETIRIRDQNGRPLWAGGRWNSDTN